MCGIFCLLIDGKHGSCIEQTSKELLDRCRVANRGPDFSSVIAECQQWPQKSLYLRGFVLHLRGERITPQPCLCSDGGFLMWNGEIFYTSHGKFEESINDTTWLADCLGNILDSESDELTIPSVLREVQGPWAFVYYQPKKRKLWFGRDILGRRSLLFKPSSIGHDSSLPLPVKSWILTSVSIDGLTLSEVPTYGLYCLDLESEKLTLFPWSRTPSGNHLDIGDVGYPLQISPHQIDIKSLITSGLNMDATFSDDDRESPEYPDPLSNDLEEIFTKVSSFRDRYRDEFEDILSSAVRRRVVLQSALCGDCLKRQLGDSSVRFDRYCGHSRVAILFSGGIDSMVIADLAHRHLGIDEPIDLLNVAFEMKARPVRNKNDIFSSDDRNFDVPDRLTGLAGWQELRRLHPDRVWNFINVNITADELREARETHIRGLVAPLQTVLDDSIGCAIWFAARGRGFLQTEDGASYEISSSARVLLLGMGADEQLGGYTRHRTAFIANGWEGLRKEIRLDVDRISERNLGRDDRIVSDHGKEARFPFLDEQVVSFLNHLPCHYKMDLSLPRGYGEKFLLRHMAHKLGLTSCATLQKRAIQFGSRIAKLENTKEKASDVCERLGPVPMPSQPS